MKFLKSIRIKVWICVGVAFIGFLVATVSTFQANARLTANLTDLRNLEFPLALKGGEVLNLFKKQSKLYEDAFLLGEEDAVRAGDGLSTEILALLKEMEKLTGSTGAARVKLEKLQADFGHYAESASRTYLRAAGGEESQGLTEDLQKIARIKTTLLASLDELAKESISAVEGGIEVSKNISRENTTFLLLLFFGVLFLAGFIINFVANRLLIRPLRNIQEMVKKLARGELDVEGQDSVTGQDEIGELAENIEDMARKLKAMVVRISHSSRELTGISGNIAEASIRVDDSAKAQARGVSDTSAAIMEIDASVVEVGQGVETLAVSAAESTSSVLEMSASVEEVALNAENLSSSVDEVSSSMAEMACAIRQVADSVAVLKEASDTTSSSVAEMDVSIKEVEQNARDTAGITETVRRDAERGKSTVDATIRGIHEIKRASMTTSEVVLSLSEKARNIGSILSVIDQVTDQTNLLALNAAIIAAQAGEHGRGFAVVADEIRELAEQTSSSTQEISAVINGVQEETRRAVEAIGQALKSIDEGEELSEKSGDVLNQIVAGVQQTFTRMDQIARATVEQSKGSRTIRDAIEKISRMVDQTASATREQNKGAELIMNATERMRELTGQVRTSTREQSNAGKVIARSMENINRMVQQIKNACDEQIRESRQIVGAVNGIQESANVNLESNKVLNGAVERLTEQTGVLQKEMAGFRFAGQEHSSGGA